MAMPRKTIGLTLLTLVIVFILFAIIAGTEIGRC
jgi:hypothetical protein